MYDELTAVDIQKMQAEIDYRKLELRPKLGAALQGSRPQQQSDSLSGANDQNSKNRGRSFRSRYGGIVRPCNRLNGKSEHRKDLCLGHNLATKSCKRVYQQRISAGRSSDG